MDHVAAGEVRHAHTGKAAATPNAKRSHRIYQGHPHRAEDHPRGRVHATQHGAGEDNDGDGGEDELEEDERRHRECKGRHTRCRSWDRSLASGVYGGRRGAWYAEERKPLRPERRVVVEEYPNDEDGRE